MSPITDESESIIYHESIVSRKTGLRFRAR